MQGELIQCAIWSWTVDINLNVDDPLSVDQLVNLR